MKDTRAIIICFKLVRGLWAKEGEWPLRNGGGKKTESPVDLPEWNTAQPILDFS